MPSFSFTNSSSTDASALPFSNPPSEKVPYNFSFPNASSGNPPPFTFNLPTSNPQVRPSFTFTSSTQKQETPNNKQPSPASLPLVSTNNPKERPTANETTPNNGIRGSQKLSDPPTPISQQSSFPSDDQEENDTPASLAENSLLKKKLNTKLFDSADLVVDRSDPSSPLYSLKSFQELNLKPDLLKGNSTKFYFIKITNIQHYFEFISQTNIETNSLFRKMSRTEIYISEIPNTNLKRISTRNCFQ